MFYADGAQVMLGDVVAMGGGDGRVVGLIGEGLYTDDDAEAGWGHLGQGALIVFDAFGLIYYEQEPEPDVVLVSRRT